MDFVTGLLFFTNRKGKIYDLILVIANTLTKKVHYELVKLIINTFGLFEVIINMVVLQYGL